MLGNFNVNLALKVKKAEVVADVKALIGKFNTRKKIKGCISRYFEWKKEIEGKEKTKCKLYKLFFVKSILFFDDLKM